MKSGVLGILLAASATAFKEPSYVSYPSVDGSTFSNVDTVITTHFHLDVYIDFGYDSIKGNNTLMLSALSQATYVVLDV